MEQDIAFSELAKSKNTSKIKSLHFRLRRKIAKNLATVVEDMHMFHEYVLELFDVESSSIPPADTIPEIFRSLTDKKYWIFLDVDKLENIVEEFSGELKDECMKLIEEYKEQLSGYKTTTSILDFIAQNKGIETEGYENEENVSLKKDAEKYDAKYRTKLSMKLNKNKAQPSTRIYMESLLYVEKLWDSLCREFKMPPLSHVLDDIMTGSIIIHWIIQHTLTWNILDGIDEAVPFFEREFISLVCLEGVCIYNQKTGVRNQKVRDKNA